MKRKRCNGRRGHSMCRLYGPHRAALAQEAGIISARINMTSKRLHLVWPKGNGRSGKDHCPSCIDGFQAYPLTLEGTANKPLSNRSAFCESWVLQACGHEHHLLSVSVWSGHVTGLSLETRDFFHWISGAIALPTCAYSGRVFSRAPSGPSRRVP